MRFVSCATLALLILLSSTAVGVGQEGEFRTLEFPEDRSLGMLYSGQKSDTPFSDLKLFGNELTELGPAQGSVQVPANGFIRLDASLEACRDLSPLKKIPSDGLHFLYFNIRAPIEGQLQHISHLTELRVLHLRGCPVTDEEILNIANLTKLESLQCSAYGHTDQGYGITDESMKIFGKFTKLKVLTLRSNPITDIGLESLATCNELETLQMAGSKVTGKGLNTLYMVPNLKNLSFGVYDEGAPIDDEGLKTLGELTQIEHLNLTASNITDEGFKHLAKLENLQTLTLDNTEITDDALQALSDLQHLKNIRFYRDKGAGLGDVAAEHLSSCPELQTVTTHWNLTSVGIEHLSNCKSLQSIEFTDTLTDADMPQIAKMTGLKRIGFQNCPITDAGLAHLNTLVNIEQFGLHGTKASTDCLETLVYFPKLKILRLGLEQNGDAPSYWPGEHWNKLGSLKDLEILMLDGLLLDDRHWPVLSELTKLTSLELRRHPGFLPLSSGFVSNISGLKNLNSLRLGFCDFTPDDFDKLGNIESLQYLTITGAIDQDKLNRLAGLPSLRILQMYTSEEIPEAAIEDFKRSCKALQTVTIRNSPGSASLTQLENGIVAESTPELLEGLTELLDKTPPKLTGEPPTGEFNLSQYEGKVVVVHFWKALSLGREPRPDELHVKKVMAKFADRDVQVVGVHVTAGAEGMEQFITEQDIDWPCFADQDNKSSELWKNYRNQRNRLYLIDREGKLQMAHVYLGDLENAVEMMLDADENPKDSDK